MRDLQSLVPEWPIGSIKAHRVNPDADSLAQTSSCTAFIVIPHSLHSYTSVEARAHASRLPRSNKTASLAWSGAKPDAS